MEYSEYGPLWRSLCNINWRFAQFVDMKGQKWPCFPVKISCYCNELRGHKCLVLRNDNFEGYAVRGPLRMVVSCRNDVDFLLVLDIPVPHGGDLRRVASPWHHFSHRCSIMALPAVIMRALYV